MFVARDKKGVLAGRQCKQIVVIGIRHPARWIDWVYSENCLTGEPVDKLLSIMWFHPGAELGICQHTRQLRQETRRDDQFISPLHPGE